MGNQCFIVEDKFGTIKDNYKTLEEVTKALEKSGLESSNLIIGIDFTASNKIKGKESFGGKCIHDTSEVDEKNPYQKAIEVIGRTLEKFDEDKLIPAFGFGDVSTKDTGVFPFLPDPQNPRYCYGFEEVLSCYKKLAPTIQLSGPTCYAPIINKAIEIVKSGVTQQYHILVIVADGEVNNEEVTRNAIIRASEYALSIIVVGVGDGPWDTMGYFDDKIKERKFDNFQFVDYTKVVKKARKKGVDPDIEFSVNALMEIPQQFKCMKNLGLIGKK